MPQDTDEIIIRGELLGGGGKTKVSVRVVGFSTFIVLKALAFKDRCEEKDAYDLIFTLREYPGGPEALGRDFAQKLAVDSLYEKTLNILEESFLDEEDIEGFDKEGPAHYGKFVAPTDPEEQDIAKRDAVGIVEAFMVEARRTSDSNLRSFREKMTDNPKREPIRESARGLQRELSRRRRGSGIRKRRTCSIGAIHGAY